VMEYFFDGDRPHWAAWLRVHDIDGGASDFRFGEAMSDAVPLYYAAFCGFYDLAEHLVIKNADHVNAKGGQLGAPLVAALHGKHYKVAELLLEHGANVDVRGNWIFTILHCASREGHVDIVRWLLNHGANVNAQGGDDNLTPLDLAAYNGEAETCRLLQVHNADLGVRTIDGATLLHQAASLSTGRCGDQLKIMRSFLDQGADVDARDNVGRTPLHYSSFRPENKGVSLSRRGTVEGSRLLLEHGADLQAEDNEGMTPLQLALENNHHEMAEFLLGMGAR